MHNRLAFALCGLLVCGGAVRGQTFHPDIPRTWADKDVAGFELPLAQRDRSPRYLSEKEYYELKVRPIYRSYPVYVPGREPAGYLDSLKQKEPEAVFDPSKLRTKQDWIDAGNIVFESDTLFFPGNPGRLRRLNLKAIPVSADGQLPELLPFGRYYIRKKGVLEFGLNSCAGCHTRVMPDGSMLEGAQGVPNLQLDPAANAEAIRNFPPDGPQGFIEDAWVKFGAPWIAPKDAFVAAETKEERERNGSVKRSPFGPACFPARGRAGLIRRTSHRSSAFRICATSMRPVSFGIARSEI